MVMLYVCYRCGEIQLKDKQQRFCRTGPTAIMPLGELTAGSDLLVLHVRELCIICRHVDIMVSVIWDGHGSPDFGLENLVTLSAKMG